MNNTAIQKRTDAPPFAFALDAAAIRSVVAFGLISVLWISFTPFAAGVEIPEGGNVINQVGYSGFCAAAFAVLAMYADRRVLMHLLSPGWILMFALVLLSAQTSPASDDAFRSVFFTLIATVMAAIFFVLAPSADALSRVLVAACATVLVLSYAGLVIFPDAALHQSGGLESNHAGLWRGLFTHKNLAGPVMASISFVGIYLMRRDWRLSGAAITLLALFFVWNTGSKTSMALVPAIIAAVAVPALFGMRAVGAFVILIAIVGMHALTVGTVFVPAFDSILRSVDPLTTYTGRTEIWDFAGDFVTRHPWTGFGYDSFWQTALTANAEQPFDRTWDPRFIVHGHNGFLDIVLFMGFPALYLAIWLFVLAPIWQFLRTPLYRENVLLADLCLMIAAFITMNAALESYFFRRADPVWVTLIIALFGLRLCSRMRIR
jgi:O-antigen ligase